MDKITNEDLIQTLKTRFEKNISRHKEVLWADVEKSLLQDPKKLESLMQMENTGGEPDVINFDNETKEYTFCDCSPESPKGRRSLCYDKAALESRKEHKPSGSAVQIANDMGIDLLNQEQYQFLQTLGKFDTKTSSWIETPAEIRKLGGALFGDCRYDHVFFYHNGAESYYAARGFRGVLRIKRQK